MSQQQPSTQIDASQQLCLFLVQHVHTEAIGLPDSLDSTVGPPGYHSEFDSLRLQQTSPLLVSSCCSHTFWPNSQPC